MTRCQCDVFALAQWCSKCDGINNGRCCLPCYSTAHRNFSGSECRKKNRRRNITNRKRVKTKHRPWCDPYLAIYFSLVRFIRIALSLYSHIVTTLFNWLAMYLLYFSFRSIQFRFVAFVLVDGVLHFFHCSLFVCSFFLCFVFLLSHIIAFIWIAVCTPIDVVDVAAGVRENGQANESSDLLSFGI